MNELNLMAELETKCPECGRWVLDLFDEACEDCDDAFYARQAAAEGGVTGPGEDSGQEGRS